MIEQLIVDLFDRHAGEVAVGAERFPENWSFRYNPAYLDQQMPVALSASLPLRAAPYEGAVVRNWFCNLLPEGLVREAVVARLRLPDRDDFALLRAIGGECAGAVSVRAAGDGTAVTEPTALEELLNALGPGAGEGAWALTSLPRRLSLAGAQDKIAVILDDGRLRLPGPGEFSTHIVKPESRNFRGLRDFEAFGLALAHAVGLKAASAQPIRLAGRAALLVQRYDRGVDTAGKPTRLHQEDFCQVLGYPPELKYQATGGPSLAECAARVRSLALGPPAVQGFLDWVVFNALIGNADAHAKNLSLLCDSGGNRSLAPFYDLVPTIALPETLVDRTPAFSVGAAQRIDAIDRDDWRRFAEECGYGAPFVLRRVRALADAVHGRLDQVEDDAIAAGADAARLAHLLPIVRAQVDRIGSGA